MFTEQNFNSVESMGVVVVARYIFELSVWLSLFKLDRRYGLVYFAQLIDTQQRYYQDVKAQLEREVASLKSFSSREEEAHKQATEQIQGHPPDDARAQALASTLRSISEALDVEASRRFSLYAKDAQTRGYGFQTHLIETQAVPRVDKALAEMAVERSRFDATIEKGVKELIPGRWQWRQMAQKVNLTDEYDYIYSFASKILHATPSSITTDQKNLELPELEAFLKYIDVKMADIETLAQEYLP
jgi:hypothetical protein